MDAHGVTVRLHTCTMMCWMRDEVSQDVSNLQTSKLKPAVQQNTCSLLSLSLSLPLPVCTALSAIDSRDEQYGMQPLQLLEVPTDVLAPPKTHIKVTLKVRITPGTVHSIVRLCELSPASLCDQQKITRLSLPGHQVGPCSQHLVVCIVSCSPQSDVLSTTSLLCLPTSGATDCAIS